MVRKFRPRKKLPKDEMIELLSEGYTLQEIADKYNVAVSYVSEYLKMLNINLKDFAGRDKKIQLRKQKKQSERINFIDEFYDSIKNEIGKG
jgi:predicted DNA-binding protein YlxM (UPF0122 family)